VADRSAVIDEEATLYDVLATSAPDGLEQGETRITKTPETSDEEPAVFPGLGINV
jgi:hypothetical protein